MPSFIGLVNKAAACLPGAGCLWPVPLPGGDLWWQGAAGGGTGTQVIHGGRAHRLAGGELQGILQDIYQGESFRTRTIA